MTNTNTNTPSIIVLLDLKKDSADILTTANELARKINGKLQVLHVKEPSKVVKQDNQFSAKKELYEDSRSTQERMENLLKGFSRSVDYDLAYGNIKNSILETLTNRKPNIIVMGKRSKKLGGIVGDRLTDAIIDNVSASVLIVDSNKRIPESWKISVGMLNSGNTETPSPWKNLLEDNADTISYFSVESKTASASSNTDEKKAHFVFSEGSNAFESLVSYADKTGIQLFYIPKGMKKEFPKKMVHKLKANVLFVQ